VVSAFINTALVIAVVLTKSLCSRGVCWGTHNDLPVCKHRGMEMNIEVDVNYNTFLKPVTVERDWQAL
jgi:hypothetical protein